MNGMMQGLDRYIDENIIPQYHFFDKGHDHEHIEKVIQSSLTIARAYDVDINMVFVIAAYHDVGLVHGRKNHNIASGIILMEDKALCRWFSQAQLVTMKEAIEDHRASNDYEPRTIYGAIISEADRDIHLDTILYRTMQYGRGHYPTLSFDEQFERAVCHLESKYGENGYVKLWLQTDDNVAGLDHIRTVLKNRDLLRTECFKYYQ